MYKFSMCATCRDRNACPDCFACRTCKNALNYRRDDGRQRISYTDYSHRRTPGYSLDGLIDNVIFNPPFTIVMWNDGFPKTVVKCQEGDTYDREKGLAMCIVKRSTYNTGKYYDVFKKWCDNNEKTREDRTKKRKKEMADHQRKMQKMKGEN